MRWNLLLSLVFAGMLVPACSLSEASASGCPPLQSVSFLSRALSATQDAFSRPWNRETDEPAILVSSYYDMCKEQPALVACAGGGDGKLSLSEVQQIDASLRARFEYRSDYLTSGSGDHWMAATTCGDCEDYALTLSEDLHAAGEGGKNMGVVLWFPTDGAHATLAVETSDAGLVEVSVGYGGEPRRMNWSAGVRVAVIWLDGAKQVSQVPGWPAPVVSHGVASIPVGAKSK